jgi:hypothetical protein
VTLLETYRQLGPVARLDQARAARIVDQAIPHALSALGGRIGSLPVRAECMPPDVARGGSVIPAWPIRQADGGVVIEYVADWGALLAGWLSLVGASRESLTWSLVERGERVWIGIANDVLQLFVNDPPTGSYSMVRHHALMLAAATTWLGADATRAWRGAHANAARSFLRAHAEPLWVAIARAEDGLTQLLDDERVRQAALGCVEWLDGDIDARARYADFLGAASLGVAAVLDALEASSELASDWIAHAVAYLHAQPGFNRDWIEASARQLREPCRGARS